MSALFAVGNTGAAGVVVWPSPVWDDGTARVSWVRAPSAVLWLAGPDGADRVIVDTPGQWTDTRPVCPGSLAGTLSQLVEGEL